MNDEYIGHADVAQLLIENKAHIDSKNKVSDFNNITYIHSNCMIPITYLFINNVHLFLISYILTFNAIFISNVQDECTPLHLTSQKGIEIIHVHIAIHIQLQHIYE